VDVARDEQHHLALGGQPVGVRVGQAPRVGQASRGLLDVREVRDVLLGRDHRHHHVLAERRLAEVLEHDARRRGVERLQVGLDLAVVRERAVGADRKAEELGGGLDGGAGGHRQGRGQHGEERQAHRETSGRGV
jgi:hypothetical protein